jgi:hypothetical protein
MRWIHALLILSLPLQCAWAQQNSGGPPSPASARPAPQSMPSPDEVNPAVDTTPAATPSPAPAPSAAPASPAPGTRAPATPPAAATAAPGAKGQGKNAARGAASADRVELGTTDITGNRELPKVLYIVPWKRSDLGDLVGKPPNSLLDEVLQPIDRDVFLRENRYYDALQPGRAHAPGDSVQGSSDKPSP